MAHLKQVVPQQARGWVPDKKMLHTGCCTYACAMWQQFHTVPAHFVVGGTGNFEQPTPPFEFDQVPEANMRVRANGTVKNSACMKIVEQLKL